MTDNQHPHSNNSSKLSEIINRRDTLIRQIWMVYRDMSDVIDAENFDYIDLDLWEIVTKHNAVQSMLRDNT